jgi:membrane protein YqaA with SNARE-associated domain
MDLSWVPAKVIRFWIDEFLNQAAQERFEDTRSLSRFELKMRTVISILAEGLPKVEEALSTIIGILKVNE